MATYGNTKDFPAFYARRSGCKSPYNVTSPAEAASIIKNQLDRGLESGFLFGVPVPEEFALNEQEMERVIELALGEAREKGIAGKEITPFLLSRIVELTKGSSLQTSIL